ncbi:MAG: hypothetical protein QOK15_2854 [Nocardioidaceae bacterium]|nr:hypothetical protein [Nocardioidaceae bacterium]
MPARLRLLEPPAFETAVQRFRAGDASTEDLRALAKHFLAVLSRVAPGGAVEVRVPPYAAVQVVGGLKHKRGTPPAVVEMDASTWVALALGDLTWRDADRSGRLVASGERSDLGPLLPLDPS